jgi:hypothetical protein
MKSIDALLDRKYDPEKYHCVHFLIEAADYIFGLDYSDSFVGLTTSLHETLQTSRHTATRNRQIGKPVDGTIVLMTNINQSSHVGLFYCGRVLHLTEMGTHFLPLITIKRFYKRIRYYEPITHSEEPG